METLPRILSQLDEAALLLSPSGEVTFCNLAFLKLTGYEENEVFGSSYATLLLGQEDARAFSALETESAEPVSCEVGWRRKGGGMTRLLCHHYRLAGYGRPGGLAVVSHTGAERSIRPEPEAKFKELLEAAPDAMVLVDAGGKIDLVNSQAEALFGYTREELLGQPLEILIPQRYREDHVKHRQSYSKAPRVRRMGAALELFGSRKNGSEFPVEVSLSPLKTSTGVMVMSAIRDISDRKHAEDRIRASLHEKEVLLKEVHHRVKNNLQVINSILNLQSDTIDDPKVREIFNETRLRIRSIALVHERLYQSQDLARIDFGDYVDGLVADLFRSFGAEGRDIRVQLEVRHPSLAIDKTINCGLVINELISNSLKYAYPSGRGGVISISLAKGGPGMLRLAVKDDGVGLPSDFATRSSDSLGLKLVRGLSRELGGDALISGESGVSFEVSFPE